MEVPRPLIRPADVSDAGAIADVYAPYVMNTAVSFEAEPPSAETMAERIRSTIETHPWLVAEAGGDVVGYAYAGRHSERAAYRWTVNVTVYVSQEVCRSGIGRALYEGLVETLRRQGFRSAFAEIVLPNPGSVRLHEAADFRLIGIHKDIGFKLGCWHDIGYWRLGLADGSAAPNEPIPFAALKSALSFADVVRRGNRASRS